MRIKRFAVVLVCFLLLGTFAACDMEFGGLVGELFTGGEDVNIGEQPIEPVPGRPVEDVTMGLGEKLYGFPESLQLDGAIVVYETQGVFSAFAETGSEVFAQAKMGYVQQFTDLYGYPLVHSFADADDVMDIAKKESMAGSGTLNLCYLPLAYIGQISTSGAFLGSDSLVWQSGCLGSDSFNEDLRIGGKQYAFAGFLNPSVEFGADCLVYNWEMMQSLGYDVNEYYYDNNWTLDKYFAICEEVAFDLNLDDGSLDGARYGAAYGTGQAAEHMFYGSGLEMFDNQKVNVTDGDDYVKACAKIGSISINCFEGEGATDVFLGGHALFYATTLGEFAGVTSGEPMMAYAEFIPGVIPTPVYESGVGYVSNVDPYHANVLAVGRGAQGDVSMVLNVLGVLAGNHLMPATEKWMYKVNPMEESVRMCYEVMNHVSCDVDSVMLREQGFDCNPVGSDPVSFINGRAMSYEVALGKILRQIQSDK